MGFLVLDDGISQHLLVPHSDVASFFDHLDILRDVRAPTQEVAVGDVLHVDKPVVLVALVPESEWTLVLFFLVVEMRSAMRRRT
jgi:hypothetical protein